MSLSCHKLLTDIYTFSSDEDGSTPLVISVLASLLERAMARTQRIQVSSNSSLIAGFRSFDSQHGLEITVQSFLERIFRHTRLSSSVFVVAYAYIDRLCQFHPGFRISCRNVHRLLITTVMVASKFVEDMNYKNSYFARVGGLRIREMNALEVDFLFLMKFKLQVSIKVFESYCSHLEREVAMGGGYQIERTLNKLMCGGEIASKSRCEEHELKKRPSIVG
ncbi:hypothetical protein AMTRI_Chr13g116510 [Amborella trichopoda]|uniref:Cyclin n=1 Tax=Amborella trichopoda TaxID=13333 RepID=W1NTG3_AMBTC|nr:cyclin-U2-1 [Amborella trichopoda]ERN00747.1 hypothetical protein AMTR_s00106p00124350 [Amborella trichopoda]|eukprot:XP_006838178.1 cyclin-U2-1 [Amborella trichopoda]